MTIIIFNNQLTLALKGQYNFTSATEPCIRLDGAGGVDNIGKEEADKITKNFIFTN